MLKSDIEKNETDSIVYLSSETEIVNLAKACTKVMDEMVNDAPSLKKLLSVLNSQRDGHIYVHSILAAFVCSYMIKRVSWGGESHIEKINFTSD